MAFVHGLVRTRSNGRKGWCAPVELGEAAPHYVAFVIPVDEQGAFFEEYDCETITAEGESKRRATHELLKKGKDSFLLRLGNREAWFTVRPVSAKDRRAPYVGELGHDDFRYQFTEIEPEDPGLLDRLYADDGIFVIGCDPFAHYAGIKTVENGRRRSAEGGRV